MVNKKNDSIDKADAEVALIDELSQLRAIVFGAAEHKLIEQITILRRDMEHSISSLDQSVSTKIAELQQQVDLKLIEIDKRITFIDKAHDDNSASIQKSLDNQDLQLNLNLFLNNFPSLQPYDRYNVQSVLVHNGLL